MRDMLAGRDLVLLGYSSYEAEYVLHLSQLVLAAKKVVVVEPRDIAPSYWTQLGVWVAPFSASSFCQKLQPVQGSQYSMWDMPMGRRAVEILRQKSHDCFICYFSGDKAFVRKLHKDLGLRDVNVWRDEGEIDIGDSITSSIERGLQDSFSCVIVLSPETLTRPMVKEELRAAYNLRLAGDFKILPVLHKDCQLPPLLLDYRYADFRDPMRYDEQLTILVQAIHRAARQAQKKA